MNPAFGDKTNHLVWEETLDRTQVMVQLFRGPDGQPKTVKKIDDHIKRLSLEVLGRAGLGEKLEWSNPIYENRGEATLASRVSSEKPGIADSLEYIMTNVISVMTIKSLPRWIQSFGKSNVRASSISSNSCIIRSYALVRQSTPALRGLGQVHEGDDPS